MVGDLIGKSLRFKQLWRVIYHGLSSRWLLACAEGMPVSTTFRTLKGQIVHNGWGMPALHGERAVAVSLIFSYNLNKLHIPDIE